MLGPTGVRKRRLLATRPASYSPLRHSRSPVYATGRATAYTDSDHIENAKKHRSVGHDPLGKEKTRPHVEKRVGSTSIVHRDQRGNP